MLDMLRDLVAHKGHANAALLGAIQQNDAASTDPEVRELLMLRYGDGLSSAEISQLLGVSTAAVEHPSEKGMMFDQLGWHVQTGTLGPLIQDPKTHQVIDGARRHILYVDGHVRFEPISVYGATSRTATNEKVH